LTRVPRALADASKKVRLDGRVDRSARERLQRLKKPLGECSPLER
jgi:hypothetical protein